MKITRFFIHTDDNEYISSNHIEKFSIEDYVFEGKSHFLVRAHIGEKHYYIGEQQNLTKEEAENEIKMFFEELGIEKFNPSWF